MNHKSDFQTQLQSVKPMQDKDLIQENQNIAELKKYLLELNNIKIQFKNPQDKNKPPEN